MKKISISALILLLISIILTGCGIGKVDEKNVEKDLVGKTFYLVGNESSGGDKLTIKSGDIKDFKISKVSLNKNTKKEIIITEIKLAGNKVNEATGEISTYAATGQLKNTYSYYTKGGWVLDKVERASSDNWKVDSIRTGNYSPLPDLAITEDKVFNDILSTNIDINVGSKPTKYAIELTKDNLKSVKVISTSDNDKERRKYVNFTVDVSSDITFFVKESGENIKGYNIKGTGNLIYKYNDLEKSWQCEIQNITDSNKTNPSAPTKNLPVTKEQAKALIEKKLGASYGFSGDDKDQGNMQELNNMNCFSFPMNEKNAARITTFYVEISSGKIFNEFGYEVP